MGARRRMVAGAMLCLFPVILTFAEGGSDSPMDGPMHRVVYNDDSEALAYPQGGTVDGFLSVRTAPLIDTDVTTISWSVLGICGDAPVYDSKMQPIFGDAHGGIQPGYPHYVPNIKNLIAEGNCPLKLGTALDSTVE